MSRLTRWMDRAWYPAHANNWDDELFRRRLLEHIGPRSRCLDYGAGRGNVQQMNFRGLAAFVAGIDPEAVVFENPFLDAAATFDVSTNHIPHPDQSFDVVYADNVMEHVADPVAALREVRRVLKPGGRFLAKTPNKWHYMPVIARLTPTGFHRFYNGLRGRAATDTFPTLYRCNTAAAVAAHAAAAGLKIRRVDCYEGRPEYLRLFAATYAFGFAYERIVNALPWLARLRCVLIFELERSE
jgi:SAM-dependent methyltransferase